MRAEDTVFGDYLAYILHYFDKYFTNWDFDKYIY